MNHALNPNEQTESETPIIVQIFGTNCVGKSTVGKALASRFQKCAFIEVDELRYKVVGGLVAYSRGLHPRDHPESYSEQCWMGVDNALRLAEGFASKGFSTVIEGLEDDCIPGSGWSHPTLARHRTLTVALIPDEAVVVERWKQRTGEETLPRRQCESLAWYRANEGVFDLADSGSATPDQIAEAIYTRCVSS